MEDEKKAKEEITSESFRDLLWNLRYDLKEQMFALITAKKLDEDAIMEKAKLIRKADAHVNACYGIGKFQLKIKIHGEGNY